MYPPYSLIWGWRESLFKPQLIHRFVHFSIFWVKWNQALRVFPLEHLLQEDLEIFQPISGERRDEEARVSCGCILPFPTSFRRAWRLQADLEASAHDPSLFSTGRRSFDVCWKVVGGMRAAHPPTSRHHASLLFTRVIFLSRNLATQIFH